MPELPEVETTVRGLKKVLPNLKIKNVWSDLKTKKLNLEKLKKGVVGRKITSIKRRGKNVLIFLEKGKAILIHLKMTGHLLYGKYRPGGRFIHVIFSLSNGQQLAFSDIRKFGKVVLIEGDPYQSPYLSHLGPEPLEKNFTFLKFKEILDRKPNWKIKTLLMDQTLIVGIGNIYSDEILWQVGIHPEEREKNISLKKNQAMFKAVKKVLKKGINFGGDSVSDYRNIEGKRGKFQLHHRAYQKTGEKCGKKDGGVIIRKKIGGRSAHFCSVHQKLIKRK